MMPITFNVSQANEQTFNNNQPLTADQPGITAQVVQHLQPGGIESLALDLSKAYESQHKSLIISLEGEQDRAKDHWPKLRKHPAPMLFTAKQPGIQPGLILKLARLFRQHRVNRVHTHHIGPLFYAGVAARLAGIRYLIHTEHDSWHLEAPSRRRLQKIVLKLLRPTLVADAVSVARAMQRHLGSLDIRVIHNGIDCSRFRPGDPISARRHLKLPDDVPLVGCSGRLEQVKGQHRLISALALMPAQVHLALAGRGSCEQALKNQAASIGLRDRVHFLGHIEQMPRFYQALDLFCLPSLNEGFPLSVLEAQACGITAAVTDVGGSLETLCPSSGVLLEADDIQGMATNLQQMLKNPSPVNPRAFVLRNGDLQQTIRAYQELQPGGNRDEC
jgi:glycosyltransferase involved in cell wall biosynthesis